MTGASPCRMPRVALWIDAPRRRRCRSRAGDGVLATGLHVLYAPPAGAGLASSTPENDQHLARPRRGCLCAHRRRRKRDRPHRGDRRSACRQPATTRRRRRAGEVNGNPVRYRSPVAVTDRLARSLFGLGSEAPWCSEGFVAVRVVSLVEFKGGFGSPANQYSPWRRRSSSSRVHPASPSGRDWFRRRCSATRGGCWCCGRGLRWRSGRPVHWRRPGLAPIPFS